MIYSTNWLRLYLELPLPAELLCCADCWKDIYSCLSVILYLQELPCGVSHWPSSKHVCLMFVFRDRYWVIYNCVTHVQTCPQLLFLLMTLFRMWLFLLYWDVYHCFWFLMITLWCDLDILRCLYQTSNYNLMCRVIHILYRVMFIM